MCDPLDHPLVEQRLRHVAIELRIEPRHQPADLGPIGRRAVDHRDALDRFLEIFAYRHRIDQDDAPLVIGHHRGLPGGVHVDESVAPFPGVFAHQLIADILLVEQDAELARERTQRELIELPHRRMLLGRKTGAGEAAWRGDVAAKRRFSAPGGRNATDRPVLVILSAHLRYDSRRRAPRPARSGTRGAGGLFRCLERFRIVERVGEARQHLARDDLPE